MERETYQKPPLYVLQRAVGQGRLIINFGVEVRLTESGEVVYRYHSVALPVGVMTRGSIVNAMVSTTYPSDVMQAIVNNHLLDPTDEEHEREFREMQAYRKLAKETAKKIIDELERKEEE